MARTIPRTFPHESDTSSWAEKTFFDACRENLSDDWLVLYSQHYVGQRPSLGQKNGSGEVDFILLHRVNGIIVIEVKGGQIDLDEGQWFSSNSKGRHMIKNPFAQAGEGARAVLTTLKKDCPNLRLVSCVNHAVAFPAVQGTADSHISTYGQREITIYRDDLGDLSKKLGQIAAFWGQKPKWNEADFKAIKSTLVPTTRTPGVSYIEYVNILNELERLTDMQAHVMRHLTKNSGKSIITGGAGTGKTLVGMAHAQSLARAGKPVLYLCANKALALHLQRDVEDMGLPVSENLTVDTASSYVNKVGRAGTEREEFEIRRSKLPSREARFLDAIDQFGLEEKFDCLVVDEAQDVSIEDFQLVELLIRDQSQGGSIVILGDPNQQLMLGRINSALGPDKQPQSFSLDINCRNTLEIASLAHTFTSETIETLVSTSGIKVRKTRQRGSMKDQVVGEINTIRNEYDPRQIVVLTLNGIDDLGVTDSSFIDGQRWESLRRRHRTSESDDVRVYSARGFQGREADAVVVALNEKSLLRTFPFTRFVSEARRDKNVLNRAQSRIDLDRVNEMFKRFREGGVSREVNQYRLDLEASGEGFSENKISFLVREFERSREAGFEPRFSDPILQRLWKNRQKQSLRVALYSTLTRARVILSVVGDDRALKFIEEELSRNDEDLGDFILEA